MIQYTFADTFETTVECLGKAAAIPDCDWVHDRKQISKCKARRRVVWIPTGGSNSADDVPSGSTNRVMDGKPVSFQPVYRDMLTIECHIVAESFFDVESIRRAILAAVKSESLRAGDPKALTPGNYRYPLQADGQASDMHGDTQTCIQTYTLNTLIAGRHSELVAVTSVTHTCEFTE